MPRRFRRPSAPGCGSAISPGRRTRSRRWPSAPTRFTSLHMLAESIVLELCRYGGLARNIELVNAALKQRRDALVAALREHVPEADFVIPAGGYFLWLTLDADVDCTELLAAAEQERVVFIPGRDFMLEGGESSLRLSFASTPPNQIPEGVQRLARALERVRSAAPA